MRTGDDGDDLPDTDDDGDDLPDTGDDDDDLADTDDDGDERDSPAQAGAINYVNCRAAGRNRGSFRLSSPLTRAGPASDRI